MGTQSNDTPNFYSNRGEIWVAADGRRFYCTQNASKDWRPVKQIDRVQTTNIVSGVAAVDFINLPTSYYTVFQFIIYNLVPATNSTNLQVRVGYGSGPTWDTTSNYTTNTGSTATYMTTGSGLSNSIYEGAHGEFFVYDPANTSKYTQFRGNLAMAQTTTTMTGRYIASANNVTAIRFFMSSGNINEGRITLYGITYE